MTGLWLRRALMTLACGLAALVAGCGSSSVVSALTPARLVAFGDALSDLGAGGTGKYTVNDTAVNNWMVQLAAGYGRTLTSTADGGTSYARGNARITSAVDAAGGASPSVTQQITNFLAADKFGINDLVLVNGGISDVITEANSYIAGSQTSAQMMANVAQAGKDYGAQVRRLVTSGAKYVVVVGAYDLSRSPWGTATAQISAVSQSISDASTKFNDELLVSIVDLGANVLYVDAAFYFNLVAGSPTAYGFLDSSTVVCNSTDPGPGIGIGAGQVNSSLCNTSTISSGLDYTKYVFADKIYPTPLMHRLFGDFAYNKVKARF